MKPFMKFTKHATRSSNINEKRLKKDRIPSFEKYKLKPNSMQEEFIVNLRKIIEKGEKRALLISDYGNWKNICISICNA